MKNALTCIKRGTCFVDRLMADRCFGIVSTGFDSDPGNIYSRISGGTRSTFVGTVQSVSRRAAVVVAALDFRNLIADATLKFGSNFVVRF